MIISYEVTLLPLLSITAIMVVVTAFSTRMYLRTSMKTDMYLAISFGFITLLPLLIYLQTDKQEFWGMPYHIGAITVLGASLAVYWLAEKRTLSERLPLTIMTLLSVITLFLSGTLSGIAFALVCLISAIWHYLQFLNGHKKETVRMGIYLLLFLSVIVGTIINSEAFAMIYSLTIVSLLLYETVRYFDRVVGLLKSAGINSITDSLTGLFNKGFIFKKTQQLITKQPLSFVFIDIDNFKQLNDQKGHDYGDKILKSVASILKEVLNSNAYLCRFGGEELSGICLMDKTAAIKKAEQVRARIEKDLNVTVSIGVSHSKEVQDSPAENRVEALIKLADQRMYTAKTTGKNKVVSV